MIIYYLIILSCSIIGIRLKRKGYWTDYIAKDQCNAIKGIFIMIVFLRHINSYLLKNGFEPEGILDNSFFLVDNLIGQLLVAMFLFYSGYGVMRSISIKGSGYLMSFPRKRLFTTLLNFDVAVCCFLFIDFIFNIPLSAYQIGFSFIAWESVGNSNWYIFVILLCYFITYVSYLIVKIWGGHICVLVLGMSLFSMMFLSVVKDNCWYNTILCYSAGMYYSIYKQKIENIAQKHYSILVTCIGGAFVLLFVYNYYPTPQLFGLSYNLLSISFAILLVLITMKVQIYNNALVWLGANLFPLYIYQRLPMIGIKELSGNDWVCHNAYLYIVLCLTITFVISYFYKFWKLTLK